MQKWPGSDFVIYIVEQTNDNRKFNRGKLLNVGFDLAKNDGCAAVIFHDVDLLPSEELLPYYCNVPERGRPCHIARVNNRLSTVDSRVVGVIVRCDGLFGCTCCS